MANFGPWFIALVESYCPKSKERNYETVVHTCALKHAAIMSLEQPNLQWRNCMLLGPFAELKSAQKCCERWNTCAGKTLSAWKTSLEEMRHEFNFNSWTGVQKKVKVREEDSLLLVKNVQQMKF